MLDAGPSQAHSSAANTEHRAQLGHERHQCVSIASSDRKWEGVVGFGADHTGIHFYE